MDSLEKMFATQGLRYTVTSDNGLHFEAESFQKFLKDNGSKHRNINPLWPQANGEIEWQNRSLLKRKQIDQVERKDWKKAVLTYLVAYRNTPHPSTGASQQSCYSEENYAQNCQSRGRLLSSTKK